MGNVAHSINDRLQVVGRAELPDNKQKLCPTRIKTGVAAAFALRENSGKSPVTQVQKWGLFGFVKSTPPSLPAVLRSCLHFSTDSIPPTSALLRRLRTRH